MPLFSAIDAVSPALARWQRLLFRPMRWSTLLKLGFVAVVAEFSGGGGGSFNSPFGNYSSSRTATHDQLFSLSPVAMVTIIVAAVVFFIVGIVLMYLSCRMKFVEFHVAVTGDTHIGPAWSRYRRQTWRLFGMSLGVSFAALLALAAVVGPIAFSVLRQDGQFVSPSFQQILGLFLSILPILFLWILGVALVMLVIRDFMLPFWALEDASVGGAWQGARLIIERAPGDFAKYVLVKALLRIAAMFAGFFAWGMATVISAVPLAALGAAVYFPLHNGGSGAMATLIGLGAAAVLIFVIWIVLLYFIMIGTPLLALQCYSVEWLGGRYALLGSILWPLPPAPVQPLPIS